MEKFIYVFDRASAEKMIRGGYKLLKSDESGDMFIFENDGTVKFDLSNSKYALSNTLTF